MGHVPQVPVAYSKATRATLRRAQDVFDLPLWNGICIPQLQETAHVFTMDMPLTPQMPGCFFPSAVAANVPHDVVHNKFRALMHLGRKQATPFRRMVCTGVYTSLLLVLFDGWSAQAITHVSYWSFSADGLHSSPACPFGRMVCTGHFDRWSALSPTCHFRRMVCIGVYTSLLLLLFSGWSAQLSYLSFSADGLHRPLHMSPTCPFRRVSCTSLLLVLFRGWSVQLSYLSFSADVHSLLLVLFGGWSAQAITHVSSLSFLTGGLHRRLHISPTCPFQRMVCRALLHMSPTCPFRRMVCTALLLVLFGGWSAPAFTHLSYLSFSADGLFHQGYRFIKDVGSSRVCDVNIIS